MSFTSSQPSGRSSSTSEIARARARRSPSSRRWASVRSLIGCAIIAGQYDLAMERVLAEPPPTPGAQDIARAVRSAPDPLHGGPLALLRFMRANGMLNLRYARLIGRYLLLTVRVGHNVWIGYGACVLRGVEIGDNSIVGTNAVVTKDVPENAVVAGVPARVIRMREAPQLLRWE